MAARNALYRKAKTLLNDRFDGQDIDLDNLLRPQMEKRKSSKVIIGIFVITY